MQILGSGSAIQAFRVNGINSGTAGGSYISTDVGGGVSVAIGNASAILGGAFNSTPMIYTSTGNIYIQNTSNLMWHSGNDGSGSGLDADLLDGYNIGTSGGAVPLLNGTNSWSSEQIFLSNIKFSGTYPNFILYESDAATDEKYWRFRADGGVFAIEGINDPFSVGKSYYFIDRSGLTASYQAWTCGDTNGLYLFSADNGYAQISIKASGTNSGFFIFENSTNNERYRMVVDNGRTLYFSGNGGVNNHFSFNSTGDFIAAGNVTAYGTPSDLKFKTNIKPLTSGLDVITKLNPVTFDWREETPQFTQVNLKEDIGFIAQEVQEVLPEIVRENNGDLSLRERAIVPYLVLAIKELREEILALKGKHDTLN